MRVDYNRIFFRDTNMLHFTDSNTGERHEAYVAGVFMQTFGILTYELGIFHSAWMGIYNSSDYIEAPKDKWSDGKGFVKVRGAEVPVVVEIPMNAHVTENVPGKISNLYKNRDKGREEGFFDCLEDRGIIDRGIMNIEHRGNLRFIQITISWDDMENLDKKFSVNRVSHPNIFTKIDID